MTALSCIDNPLVIAALLGVSKWTVYKWIKSNIIQLPASYDTISELREKALLKDFINIQNMTKELGTHRLNLIYALNELGVKLEKRERHKDIGLDAKLFERIKDEIIKIIENKPRKKSDKHYMAEVARQLGLTMVELKKLLNTLNIRRGQSKEGAYIPTKMWEANKDEITRLAEVVKNARSNKATRFIATSNANR